MKRYDTMGFESEYGVWVRWVDADALAADLEDARLIAREQNASAIAANLRCVHLQERLDFLETARDRLLSSCQDSDDAQYGTLSTTFVQHCFAQQVAPK